MGYSGQWTGYEMCDPGEFIYQAKVAYQDAGSLDETALNGLIIKCVGFDANYEENH